MHYCAHARQGKGEPRRHTADRIDSWGFKEQRSLIPPERSHSATSQLSEEERKEEHRDSSHSLFSEAIT